MGFYSIYRIIKDIVRTLFGNKFWKTILIIGLVLLFLFNFTKVFAASDSPNAFTEEEKKWIVSILEDHPEYTQFFCHHAWNSTIVYFINSTSSSDKFYLLGETLYCTNPNLTWYKYTYSSTGLSWSGSSKNGHKCFSNAYDRYCSADIYADSIFSEISYKSTYAKYEEPHILNTAEDLATGKFDYLLITPGSLTRDKELGIRIHQILKGSHDLDNDGVKEEYEYYDTLFKLQLNNNNTYYKDVNGKKCYQIPRDKLGISFKNENTYIIEIVNDIDGNDLITPDTFELYSSVRFTIGGLTAADEESNRYNNLIQSNKDQTDAIKDQTNAIKDQTDAIKDTSDKIFSDDYDESKIDISTSESDKVDGTKVTNFVTSLLQNIQNIATGNWNSVETISIPLRLCRREY